jgi:hypothetical protein
MIKNKRTKAVVAEGVVNTQVTVTGVDFDIDATRSIPVVEETVSRGTVIYTTDKIFTDMEIITENAMVIAKQFKLAFTGVKFTLPSLIMNISKVVTFLKTVKPNIEIILQTIKD